MIIFNLWSKIKAGNLIAEFLIVTLSVTAALAGDKYLAHLSTLEQEEVALKLIHEDLKRNYNDIQWAITEIEREDSVFVILLRHAAKDTALTDSMVNAGFKDLLHFRYFDRTVANTHNYDSKIKNAGKQVIQSDSLSQVLSTYYDLCLNNLTLWTEGRKDNVFAFSRLMIQESAYLYHGHLFIHQIQGTTVNEVLGEMTSNIRIMGMVSDQLSYNKYHWEALVWTNEKVFSSIKTIEDYLNKNNLNYDHFNPNQG